MVQDWLIEGFDNRFCKAARRHKGALKTRVMNVKEYLDASND